MQPTLATLRNWYENNTDAILRDFFTFLRFKSISTDPLYASEVRKTADWLCDYLHQIGLEATLWDTSGYPCIFASYLKAGPSRPTLLIYHHYDVQPVDPVELWDSPPFEPVIKNECVFARGALDNKGQCFYSITAIKAFLALAQEIKVNIKIFIEGEEESGGRGTAGLVPQKQHDLKADYLLVIDSDLPKAGVPGITLGIRGMVALNIECKNSAMDLHSGTHGGIVLNPNRALVGVLAKLWDESGQVAVPGFYDDVKMPTPAELALYDMDFDREEYMRTFGVKAFAVENGYLPLVANGARPALEINGISGGYTGIGFKTVIPAVATAKLSCRLVPDQDPEKIQKNVAHFLKTNVAKGIELTVDFHHGAPAFRSPRNSTIVKIAAQAYEEMFQQPCRFRLSGGSIPIVVDLAKASGAETAMMGFGLPEDDIHSPNEHFGLDRFEMGFLTMGRILALLSESSTSSIE